MNRRARSGRGPLFWTTTAIGWALIIYGARGVWIDPAATPPAGFTRWFVGLALVHDVVLAPLALTVAWMVGRAVPPRAVVPVRLGMATTGLLVLFTWPLVRGYGRAGTNPSALPLDYGRNLFGVVIVTWLCVAAWIAAKTVRNHRLHAGSNRGARE